ncbi:hypothetical protein Q4489_10805 [Thalassotalea sp. 1_MG-2023]|uniref:hypothetical protein n=1 Tax=Thalassotalea sp. 1_MG-2023 TaxID=3062680 RepID=UPI0026E48241|nr:hypothetical protein [Thalassotalea sp. 1_MG-2023]MDO6427508.1 hypothetical protein [Thalassotalea sp. 1_MG-2023]
MLLSDDEKSVLQSSCMTDQQTLKIKCFQEIQAAAFSERLREKLKSALLTAHSHGEIESINKPALLIRKCWIHGA